MSSGGNAMDPLLPPVPQFPMVDDVQSKGKGKVKRDGMGLAGVGSGNGSGNGSSGDLGRGGGSGSVTSLGSSGSDLSGARPSKRLSAVAAGLVDAVAGLPAGQRAEVVLELNRLYPHYAIPVVPSLPAAALPTMSSLPSTLPDGRSQKTCTLCGQVGHNSRSRNCPRRTREYGK
jgi:hypothetical protein